MNEDLIELLSRSLDEKLSPADQARLDEALAQSAELRALAEEMTLLVRLAPTPVPPAPAPGPRLRARLAAQTRPSRRWHWGLALAAAAALVLALWPRTQAPAAPAFDPAWENARLNAAEVRQRYHQDVAHMEQLAILKLAELPPEQARRYAAQWAGLDRMMRFCERRADAVDAVALQGLAQVFAARVQLYDAILAS